MTLLAAAALFWLFLHLVVAGSPLRGRLISAIGANPYRGLFSLLSALGLAALALAWRAVDSSTPLWSAGPAATWATLFLMLPAMIFFVGSVTDANPGAVGGERLLGREDLVRGIFRVTRHPMLWAFAIWAACHLAMRGTVEGVLFFGAILLSALAGMWSIDRKRVRAAPQEWAAYTAVTSIIPFAAILGRRNRLRWREIAGWRLLLAILAWGLVVTLHPIVLGVPALPG